MKRLLAVLVLVALVGSSGCTLITTAVKDTTEGRSWRELLFPSWEEMKQQISDAAEKGRQGAKTRNFEGKSGAKPCGRWLSWADWVERRIRSISCPLSAC